MSLPKSGLVGCRIVEVRPMTGAEIAYEGWSDGGTALVLDNGEVLYASQDPEGNGPGALFGRNKNGGGFQL